MSLTSFCFHCLCIFRVTCVSTWNFISSLSIRLWQILKSWTVTCTCFKIERLDVNFSGVSPWILFPQTNFFCSFTKYEMSLICGSIVRHSDCPTNLLIFDDRFSTYLIGAFKQLIVPDSLLSFDVWNWRRIHCERREHALQPFLDREGLKLQRRFTIDSNFSSLFQTALYLKISYSYVSDWKEYLVVSK